MRGIGVTGSQVEATYIGRGVLVVDPTAMSDWVFDAPMRDQRSADT